MPLRRSPVLSYVASACVAWACIAISTASAQGTLPEPVQRSLQEAGLDASSLSALVTPADGGPARLMHFENRPMLPASTMKLVTTLVALEELGPTFRWKTQLLAARPAKAGVLRGPLFLRGGGAPDFNWDQMRGMLRDLRNQGVRHLEGNVTLDRSYFSPARADLGAPDFDAYPQAYYNVIPDALMLNENFLRFSLDSTGKLPRVTAQPPLQGVVMQDRLTWTDMDCKSWNNDLVKVTALPAVRGTTRVTLEGEFPRNCKDYVNLNVLDRNLYIERFVRSAWKELGGTWKGSVQDGTTPATAELLVQRQSATLADIVRLANKPSNNTITRILYLTLGETRYQGPPMATSAERAAVVVRNWFTRYGISTDGMVLENGSGLSRIENLTPTQLVALLKVGARSNWNAEFASSLPLVGLDGTMRNRLRNTNVTGRARIKTGTLTGTSAVAGYVRDVADREWLVSAMIQDGTYGNGRKVLDALIQWVADGSNP